ncbi:MAG: MATE family efflux transporter [Chloroflexi bacterium]|nr:MATE family efflux transporter [Chloroflexota bacterium]
MRLTRTQDITQGGLARNIWSLAWPATISQMFFILPSLYDTIWLGRLGHEAQAAAGLTMSVRFVMVSALMALSLGGGAVVARYVGAKEQDRANLALLQAVILMVVVSGGLGIVGIMFARPLLTLAGADAATLPLAIRYARIIFAGLIAMEVVPTLGFTIASAGSPQVMLGMTMLSTGTLLVTEPLLVDRMGVEGAALALVLSNIVGMCWGLGVLVTGRAPVRLDLRNLRLDLPMMGRILRITLPATVQRGMPNLAMSYLIRLISTHGAPTVAAWVIARRVFDMAMIPCMALSSATRAMVGQNLGAAQPERAARSVGLIARAVALISGGLLGLMALFAPQVIALFSSDAETISISVHVVRTLGVGYMGVALNFVFDAAQAGAGDTLSPMTINLIAVWLVQIPLAYLLSRMVSLGANGIWIALVLGWLSQAMLMGLRFRQGRWKLKRI